MGLLERVPSDAMEDAAARIRAVLERPVFEACVRSLERFLPDKEVRDFVTTLIVHRALGHHQKKHVVFLGPADVGKSTHILMMLSGFAGTTCMASTELFRSDSNAALNAFCNASANMTVVYIDDVEKALSESALKRSGNGIPIISRKPATGEPTRPLRPALVVLSANPDSIQKSIVASVASKLLVVPPSAMAPPEEDGGVELIDDIVDGVYSIEVLDYLIRCYNTRSERLPALLTAPALLTDAAHELEVYTQTHYPKETIDAFKHAVGGCVQSADKYVRAEDLKNAVLSDAALAEKLHITKSPGYGRLKVLMHIAYNAHFVKSARIRGFTAPVGSCFKLTPEVDENLRDA